LAARFASTFSIGSPFHLKPLLNLGRTNLVVITTVSAIQALFEKGFGQE
jgi:hypothetical protein